MLTKFEVENFKNFNEKLTIDLIKSNNYEFNTQCIENGVIKKSLIYGHNGAGKSNLGFAIFDIVSHLTDKSMDNEAYNNYYLNLNHDCSVAVFRHEYLFDEGTVTYEYGKTDFESIKYETLIINGKKFASIDRSSSSTAFIDAEGAENLKKDLGDSKISVVSYIKKNSVLLDTVDNKCFFRFLEFVNGMLFFRSLGNNNYLGFEQGSTNIMNDIIEKENVENFQEFLNDAGIDHKLVVIDSGDKKDLAFDFAGGKAVPLTSIASTGTISLALFYYWWQRIKGDSKVSFLFVDEFDAFYHHTLAATIIKYLKEIKAQTIVTTHNTSIMTNSLLRPDCYFLINEKGINSLANSTEKELREAHNIEKMYRAGSFSG